MVGNESAMKTLEAIVHPLVSAERKRFLEKVGEEENVGKMGEWDMRRARGSEGRW